MKIFDRLKCKSRALAFERGAIFGRAIMAECIRLVLSDPEVMGKDIFGNARKDRVINAANRHFGAMYCKRMEDVKHVKSDRKGRCR